MSQPLKLHDYSPEIDNLACEVLDGLSQTPKQLPPKLFYDERGSRLFDRITELDEYYVTRTESKIMERYVGGMAKVIGPHAMIVEFGSGSSVKTRILLDSLETPSAYVPIDISRDHMMETARTLAADYPQLQILPVCADYEQSFKLPVARPPVNRRVVYIPGSTIGNFHPPDARVFLARLSRLACEGDNAGALLIGVDLKKDEAILNQAYNDADGVTAEFNLNMLHNLNRKLDADFDVDRFRHVAFYNAQDGRIEMHLESTVSQTITVEDEAIDFEEKERLWTESSYKYAVEEFGTLARGAGFNLESVWQDEQKLFAVLYLTAAP